MYYTRDLYYCQIHNLFSFVNINIGGFMKNILITGARSGMIYPVIQKLKKKYHLYVTVHTESELNSIKKLYKNDKNIECLKIDITKDLNKTDKLDIDVLVCNGAVAESGSLFEIPLDNVRKNFDVNVFSNLDLVQRVSKKMIKKGEGRIVIISSLISKMPIPFLGSYSGTKAALSVFARSLYYESKLLSTKVDIVLVEPGLYKTGFNQLAFDKKYDFMDYNSFFENQVELIRKSENIFLWLFEKRNLNSIAKEIYEAVTVTKPRFRYSAPFSQNLFSKIFNLFS